MRRLLLLVPALLLTAPAKAMTWGPPHDATNGVGCLDCHALGAGTFGITKPQGVEAEIVCKSCHNPAGMAAGMHKVANHVVDGGAVTVDCGSCHQPHGFDSSADPHPGGLTALNLRLVRHDTGKYVPGALEPAVFQQSPSHFAFAEANPPWDGICQSCHSQTTHHTRDSSGDHSHMVGAACTACHPHDAGFQPAGGCTLCHEVAQGPRRPITGTGGDFVRASHHVAGDVQGSDCVACHHVGMHGSGTVRLKDPDDGAQIYAYDPANPAALQGFCLGCHDGDGAQALSVPSQPFTDGLAPPDIEGGGAWAGSAHAQLVFAPAGAPVGCFGDGSTTGCHGNGHGSDAERLLAGATGASVGSTCLACHKDGMVTNMALSGPVDDIAEAFAQTRKHDLSTPFAANGNTYTLDCTSCHNPHVVTGRHWDTDLGKSPVTRPDLTANPAKNPRAMGKTLWGASAGQKMADYAGSGTYQPPKGDGLPGSELPDYVSLCMDCHGQPGSPPFGKSWTGDPHGKQSANAPNGGCPDWYTCGKGTGWDGDDCIGSEEDCWPVMTRGMGYPIWSRPAYEQTERIAGANFTLSCTDCHESHGSPVGGMLRSEVNGGPGSTIWNTMCNNCHYYYSDWHAGMSCANASCHVNPWGSNSIHGMAKNTGTGATKLFDPELVADMRFENDLKDSGTWSMHGRWYEDVGSYATGRSGKALLLDGDQAVELGTQNAYWSTDEGKHGTWKYSEMKYNTTLEAWIHPTQYPVSGDGIAVIFSKYQDGGYELHLKDIGGVLRAAFWVNVNGGGVADVWDADCNGWRGGYSSVAIPLDRWTHVAATFDATLPDRSPADLSQGRVRVYVDGEDVTTSNPAADGECYAQPGPGEDTIFPYSQHSQLDPARCYEGHWCASPLSVGGRMWGAGQRHGLTGRIDEAKVWNVTKGASTFDAAIGPVITTIEGVAGDPQLVVTFNEGVWGDPGAASALVAADLVLTDTNGDNPRTIAAVGHEAGSKTAVVTMSAPLVEADFNADTLRAATTASIFDEHGNAMPATPVVLAKSVCPVGDQGLGTPTVFDFAEAAGSATASDAGGVVIGVVNGGDAFAGDGFFHGDGVDNGIDFLDNPTCFTATTELTLEARFQPAVVDNGTESTIQRLFLKNGDNYQVSVWRNTSSAWPFFAPPPGVASIAFWVKPLDAHGGQAWKPALTDYTACPVVAGHWYHVKVVWDSYEVGGIPVDIYLDDQGEDGAGAGEAWSGLVNCTDSDQSQLDPDRWLYEGDRIASGGGTQHIGTTAGHTLTFNGLIDWIKVMTQVAP